MGEKVVLNISPAVAQYVRHGVGVEEKRCGLEGLATLSPDDQLLLLFCLVNDQEQGIKEAARRLFVALPETTVCAALQNPDLQKGVKDLIARVHGKIPSVQALLSADLSNPPDSILPPPEESPLVISDDVISTDSISDDAISESELEVITNEALAELHDEETELEDEEPEAINEDAEEFQSKYRMAMVMGIAEKIKMALTGDKEWRSLLIKDANKLVSSSVVKNPRITDGEILTILKVGVQNDDIVRIICANKEWIKNYKIRKALIDCPKTPLPNSLRYLASLDIKDLAGYAKSKNISSVLSTQAKRMLLSKKR